MSDHKSETWLSLADAAVHANQKPGTIDRWIKEGLPVLRAGQGMAATIAVSDLDAHMRRKMAEQSGQQQTAEASLGRQPLPGHTRPRRPNHTRGGE